MNATLKKRILENYNSIDTDELYREMLDDSYGEVEIAGMTFQTSRALMELDPTAFRCGMIDYIDSLSLVEINGEYYDLDKCERECDFMTSDLEIEISDLEIKISEIQDGIEEMNSNTDDELKEDGKKEIAKLQAELDALNSELEEIKDYSF